MVTSHRSFFRSQYTCVAPLGLRGFLRYATPWLTPGATNCRTSGLQLSGLRPLSSSDNGAEHDCQEDLLGLWEEVVGSGL
jgi:hypothetical protein